MTKKLKTEKTLNVTVQDNGSVLVEPPKKEEKVPGKDILSDIVFLGGISMLIGYVLLSI